MSDDRAPAVEVAKDLARRAGAILSDADLRRIGAVVDGPVFDAGALRRRADGECGHCGNPRNGLGRVGGVRVCHTGTLPPTDDPIDCYRLVTVYGEPLGSRIPDGS